MNTKSDDERAGAISQSLEDNEVLFRSLFNYSPCGIVIAGRGGKIVRANASFCKFLHYSEEELRQRTFLDLTHPDDRDESTVKIQGLLRGLESSIQVEKRYVRKDGKIVWGHVQASAVIGTDGQPVLLFAIVQDIGARRHSDNEKKRVSQFVERLVDSAQAIVLVISTDGSIIQYNKFMEELSGYELDEVRGQNWFEIFAPSTDTERRRFLFQEAGEDGAHRGNVTEIMARDGQSRLIQWSADLLLDDDGSVSGILSIGIDITKQREAEGVAKLEKERNRAILATAMDGIVTISEGGIIESFNPSAEKMFGYKQYEIVGQDVGILMPRFARKLHHQQMSHTENNAVKKLVGVGSEHKARHKNGRIFPIHLSLSAMKIADKGGYCGIIRDLSETKRVEEHLRQAQRIEAVDRLASGVAHDFNNLLMGVTGCATVALECAETGRSNRMYLAELLRATESGKAMIQQLLAFSRKADVELTNFEFDGAIQAQEGMLKCLLGEDIEFIVDLHARQCQVRADVGQVHQILMNLVVNARDAMPKGGRLVIESSCVSRSDAAGQLIAPKQDLQAGDYVSLTVTDDGVGMSAETRERLFEPFYTTKEPGKGTGLGLATVYGNVKQFGGHIEVSSMAEGGTRFEILLPVVPGKALLKPAPVLARQRVARHETILLCEDDRLVCMAVAYYLEGAGYRVLKAKSAAEAIACSRQFAAPIHLLLADVVLPDQTGEQAAQEIRRWKPGIKVVYMSAHTSEWLKSEGRIAEELETLQKPFDRETLLSRMADVLEADDNAPEVKGEKTTKASGLGAIVLVDDDAAVLLSLGESFRGMGYEVLAAGDGQEAVDIAAAYDGQIIALVVDVILPKMMGVGVAREIGATNPGLSVIYMSGYPEEVAMQRELLGDALFARKPVTALTLHTMIQALRTVNSTTAAETTKKSRGTVLVVEDYPTARLAIADYLSSEGWEVIAASGGEEAMALAKDNDIHIDVLLVDYSLPDIKGDKLAKKVLAFQPGTIVAYMSGYPGLKLDPPGPLFTKPLDLIALTSTIQALHEGTENPEHSPFGAAMTH